MTIVSIRELGIKSWIGYYVGFCKAGLFITGMIFSYSLVEYGVVYLLITNFIDFWGETLPNAAAIVNVKEGVTTIKAILVAHIADSYLGRFTMVIICALAYIIGLILLYILGMHPHMIARKSLFYGGLVLIALGRSNSEPTLKAFFADQFKAKDKDEIRVDARINVWWWIYGFVGIMIGTFWLSMNADISWATTYKISAIAIGVACFIFLCGSPYYSYNRPSGSPLTNVCRVIWAATWKRHPDYPCQLYEKDNFGNELRLQQTDRISWLHKAAIIESSSQSLQEQQQNWRLCTITEVKETIHLLQMYRLWGTFLAYGLVKSTGKTFFIEQGSNMNPCTINNIKVPLISLFVIKFFSNLVISNLYTLLSRRLSPSKEYAAKVRIWFGMLLSIFCCTIAWRVEAQRLNIVTKLISIGKPPEELIKAMSMLWLVPQFVLLGAMEGLAEPGLEDFFYDQAPESMRDYGPPFNDCIVGIGSLLSAFCVHASRSWFADTLNDSRLDKYYRMLTILSFVNWLIYQYISTTYTFNEPVIESQLLEIIADATA